MLKPTVAGQRSCSSPDHPSTKDLETPAPCCLLLVPPCVNVNVTSKSTFLCPVWPLEPSSLPQMIGWPAWVSLARLPTFQTKGPTKVCLNIALPLCFQGKHLVAQEGFRTSQTVRAPSGLPSHLVTNQVSLLSRGPNPKPFQVLGIKARSSLLWRPL